MNSPVWLNIVSTGTVLSSVFGAGMLWQKVDNLELAVRCEEKERESTQNAIFDIQARVHIIERMIKDRSLK